MSLEHLLLQIGEAPALDLKISDSSGSCSSRICRSPEELSELFQETSHNYPVLFINIELPVGSNPIPSTTCSAVSKLKAELSSNRIDDSQSDLAPSSLDEPLLQENKIHGIVLELQRQVRNLLGDGQVDDFRHHLYDLSPRQMEVLSLLIQGRTPKEIAVRLKISLTMATKHRARLLRKLRVRSLVEFAFLINKVFEFEGLPHPSHPR